MSFPKTKKEAAAIGSVYFGPTVECKRGHLSLRYTKGGICIQCVFDRKNESQTSRQRSVENQIKANEAVKNGNTTYVPEKPCKYGHNLRFVASNNCVECDEMQREKHKISAKFRRIQKEYGLAKESYLNLVKEQKSSCKICNTFVENHFSLHIDHCHDTGKVRGLLCQKCNQAIGLLNNSIELLKSSIAYLEMQ